MKGKINKALKVFIILNTICSLLTVTNFSKASDSNFNNEILSGDMTIQSMSNSPTTRGTVYPNISVISERTYYIKNMLTGLYLDVQGGVAANGTNVWQYKFNGTQSQQWYLHSFGDGTYSIYTPLGNDGTYRYALDISNGSGENYANVQIYTPNGSDAQRFSIADTNFDTFVFFTKCSNFDKAIVLNGPTCAEGGNIDQYTYQGHYNEAWLLEPVNQDVELGIRYATFNDENYNPAYPNLTTFNGRTADCANFTSQCLSASGIHYDGDWKIYRKNFNTYQPTTVAELDNTWELCQPRTSPWISAKEFGDYWRKKATTKSYTIEQILKNPDIVFQTGIAPGDVIQIADNNLGFLGESSHTMYVTGKNTYNGKSSFSLTYHSNSQENKNLLLICQEYKNAGRNDYIVFFRI